jgi:K+-sensing histidine kinase KdpD
LSAWSDVWRRLELELLAGVAHDLKAGIAGLAATVEIARMDQAAGNGPLARFSDHSCRLENYVDRLHQLLQLEEDQSRPIVLSDLVPRAVDLYRSSERADKVKIEVYTFHPLPAIDVPAGSLARSLLLALDAIALAIQPDQRLIRITASTSFEFVNLSLSVSRPAAEQINQERFRAAQQVLVTAQAKAACVHADDGLRLHLPAAL